LQFACSFFASATEDAEAPSLITNSKQRELELRTLYTCAALDRRKPNYPVSETQVNFHEHRKVALRVEPRVNCR